jgi:hypothetical protein
MYQVMGEIKNVYKDKTKTGREYTVLQVLSNGGDRMELEKIKDWKNRTWKMNEKISIPVYISTWADFEKHTHGKTVTAV